jgi:hypothetical protein
MIVINFKFYSQLNNFYCCDTVEDFFAVFDDIVRVQYKLMIQYIGIVLALSCNPENLIKIISSKTIFKAIKSTFLVGSGEFSLCMKLRPSLFQIVHICSEKKLQ